MWHLSVHKKVLFLVSMGLAFSLSACFFDQESEISSKEIAEATMPKTLVANSARALQCLCAAHRTLSASLPSLRDEQRFNEYQHQVAAAEEDCSLILVKECSDGWGNRSRWRRALSGACALDRLYNAEPREEFEREVARALSKKMMSQSSVHLVSFGAGGMFSDVRVLIDALQQLQNRCNVSITLHVIDKIFMISQALRAGTSREVPVDQEMVSYEPFMTCMRDASLVSGFSFLDAVAVQEFLDRELRVREIVKMIADTFSSVEFSLHIHSSAEAYLDYCRENEMPPADILYASDIMDWNRPGNCGESGIVLLDLISTLVQANEQCEFFWLDNGPNGTTSLTQRAR